MDVSELGGPLGTLLILLHTIPLPPAASPGLPGFQVDLFSGINIYIYIIKLIIKKTHVHVHVHLHVGVVESQLAGSKDRNHGKDGVAMEDGPSHGRVEEGGKGKMPYDPP